MLHTERIGSLGVLDEWFNTPAIHRMHHSADPAHQAVNLGAVSMLWDRLFGTYCAPSATVEYGIANMQPSTSLAGLYLDPWRRPDRDGAS